MLRNILAVIVGFVVMGVLVFAGFSCLYMVLGTEGSYQPESWEVSTTWAALSLVISIIAALVGGLVCRLVAKSHKAVLGLVGLILVLGSVEAFIQLRKEAPTEPRPADVPMFEASAQSRQPAWVSIVNPIVGVLGVLVGGGVFGGRREPDG